MPLSRFSSKIDQPLNTDSYTGRILYCMINSNARCCNSHPCRHIACIHCNKLAHNHVSQSSRRWLRAGPTPNTTPGNKRKMCNKVRMVLSRTKYERMTCFVHYMGVNVKQKANFILILQKS